MITVQFRMKGQSSDFRPFQTMSEARAFMSRLNANPLCELYGLVR